MRIKPARIVLAFLLALLPGVSLAAPASVSYSTAPAQIDAYDFAEITATVASPDAHDPFEDATLTGTLTTEDGSHHWDIEGFCDSDNGSIFRIRFMAPQPGGYKYSVTYRQGGFQKTAAGAFRAVDAHRRGTLGVDPKYPWHFLWEGTGEHYFFNGTTAYWLVGWRDEHTIQYSIDRLVRLKVNRMRVTVAGRERIFFGEPVMVGKSWTLLVTAWPAQRPDDFTNPGFDYGRFETSYWQKFERMLRYARERDMIISVVFDMGDNKVHPEAGSEDEHRFIRYAVARFGAFSNITWDLGDDLDAYRDEKWAHQTGTLLEQWDAYHHLATSHPTQIIHQDRGSSWFGFTSYQEWSRDQHRLMLESRKLQQAAGRIIPQTNEEYGYEDHYPGWGSDGVAPGNDSADVLRKTAWDIYMAGGYQTAGESARRGTNIWPDTGGGWMNGRGDDTQTMFIGYGHIAEFFTGFEWWKTNPHDELVNNGYCLADLGKTYAIYLPHGGKVTVQLEPGTYRAEWFNANSGQRIPLTEDVAGPSWTSPDVPDDSTWRNTHDWALLLRATP
jgi:Protein of unknown function (DUF4038)/Domain of unknown function (DUF5060)/Putative collagen-binding domain of a collagenase